MYNPHGFGFGHFFSFLGFFFIILLAWSFYWKGRAMWLSARKGSLGWFIALLLINTVGILEILYVYVFSKKSCCGEKCCCGNKKCDDKKGSERCKEMKHEEAEVSCGCGHEHN